MTRKERKTLTEETKRTILRLGEDETKTIKEIAATVDINRKTVSAVLRGIHESRSSLVTPSLERRNYENQVIRNIVVCRNDLILKEISNELEEKTGIKKSESTICRKLKSLGITRKRLYLIPAERNSEAQINSRSRYADVISQYNPDNLIFLDESGFNLHTARSYGYSSQNVNAYKNVRGNRGTNLSLLSVISCNGIIAYETRSGPYNSELFVNFIERSLAEFFRANPEKILIMDNARFHHSNIVISKMNELGIAHLFIPPYSPQLNPIEEFFSMVKSRFNSIRNPLNSVEVDLNAVLSGDFNDECRGFYRNMNRWIEKARQRLDFV